MTKLNDAGREIWFSRILWSYLPTHWKGFTIALGIIAVTLAACFLMDSRMSGLFIAPLLAGSALMLWICERHSPSRQ